MIVKIGWSCGNCTVPLQRRELTMDSIVTLDTFDHIGVVVKDTKAASASWGAKIGIGDWRFTDGPVVRLAHATIGTVQYELLAPVEGQESLWGDFLAERGEGLHHICHTVPDVDEAVDKLVADGGNVMIRTPKVFAYVEIGGPGSVILELLRTR